MLMTAPFYVSTTFFTLSYNSLSDVDNSCSELVPRLNLQSMLILDPSSNGCYITVTESDNPEVNLLDSSYIQVQQQAEPKLMMISKTLFGL